MTRHNPNLIRKLYARPPSRLEETLALHLRASDLPEPVREYRFASPRRFRFDFAWPDHMLAVEVQGGVWSGGRHTRGAGFAADCEKFNLGVLAGWRILKFTGDQIKSGEAISIIEQAVKKHGTG